MAIKTKMEIPPVPITDSYPKLRRWKAERGANFDTHGPLVVLFLTPITGVALSGVAPERIGRAETWASLNDREWEVTAITLSSMD